MCEKRSARERVLDLRARRHELEAAILSGPEAAIIPSTIRVGSLSVALFLVLGFAVGRDRADAQPAASRPLTLTFAGGDYLHRWSKDGQHEFTPKGEEDLAKWNRMITVNVHEARTGDQLAEVANGVLGNYQRAGKILRTDSKPRTAKAEAEHLIAAILGNAAFLEAVFARILLHEGQGLVVVYSKRVYGAKAGNEMSTWLEANGAETERALMAWPGLPSLGTLKALR